jgi:hypothetical protein
MISGIIAENLTHDAIPSQPQEEPDSQPKKPLGGVEKPLCGDVSGRL